MNKRILTTEPTVKIIRDTGPCARPLEADDVATAIGADACGADPHDAVAPVTPAQRAELERRLADSIARPQAVTPWEQVLEQALARARR